MTDALFRVQEASYRHADNALRAAWPPAQAMSAAELASGKEHRAVVADGPVAIATEPPVGLLDRWVTRFGSGADWAVAWIELWPERLFSHRGA